MSDSGGGVTIVTQTCVREGSGEAFARWQGETSSTVAGFPGFVEQRLLPPNPPLQVDWVILQTFATLDDAKRWLASPERQKRIEGAAPMLLGRDDVHIMRHGEEGRQAGAVSAVISTRVKPGRETEYRAWERRIATAQSKAAGLQGYRFEPPVPGVQEDYVAYLRFDSEANLEAWLESPERKRLLAEGDAFTEEFHTRIARTGFDHWFGAAGATAGGGPAAWKMNMIVLMLLYPIVFLFGYFVQTPYLGDMLHTPFSVALFCGNIVSTVSLAFLVPVVANRMGWWLTPAAPQARRNGILGAAAIVCVYAGLIVVFTTFF
jgi:antibiotic biosynthesis monooxygenase (ABM) superfamily enzyme